MPYSDKTAPADFDVVVIGGNLLGSMAAIMLQRRGFRVAVLEARAAGKEQKVVVGEAITEGTSVFLRHEIGLTDWLKANVFRKFGFDFVTLPRNAAAPPERMEDCHELLLSTSPLEHVPAALHRLIPTYHVERTSLNAEVQRMALQAGAVFRYGAVVEHVDLGDAKAGLLHAVRYVQGEQPRVVTCRWVLDCSGRRTLLGRQLGITHAAPTLKTASVWNRFEGVNDDPAVFRSFKGIDRRRHTIHFTGAGFWIWWIHQSAKMTSVGVSYDKEQHQPDLKTADKGFAEMMRKFPPAARLLEGARALEPFQYYANLPYVSEHWLSDQGYMLIGDAAWFVDALYSIGIETACRQLINAVPLLVDSLRGKPIAKAELDELNAEFTRCQSAVVKLNEFKYRHAWASPHLLVQTAVYELGEIAELYYLQTKQSWRPELLKKHYRLQWYSEKRVRRLERFMESSRADENRDFLPGAQLLKKALLPGPPVYRATWPLWNIPGLTPYFFKLIRGWAYLERLTQRLRLWPDGLSWMARSELAMRSLPPLVSKPEAPRRLAGG